MIAQKSFFACAALGVAALSPAVRAAPPTGLLVYLHDSEVCIAPANGGMVDVLPLSKGTVQLSVAPRGGGTVVFFAPRQNKAEDGASAPLQAFFSRPPYRVSRPLPIFLSKDDATLVSWTADGAAEIEIGDLRTRRLDPRTGRLSVEGENVAKTTGRRHVPGSADIRAYTDGDNRVVVQAGTAGEERVLFSPAAPQPLFAAFDRAHNPASLKELGKEIDPALWKDPHNWSVGAPAMTPDRKTLFFAANLGASMGAQGNTSFCLFAADVRTGRLSVLSRAGSFFGRTPTDSEVSPDGARLCFSTSAHSSAIDNASSVYVVDLPTQQTRELLRGDPARKNDTNLIDGWRWSPDGRFIAIAVLYYNPLKIDPNSDPDMGQCTLYIKDAATGRTIRQIPHAHLPEWSAPL